MRPDLRILFVAICWAWVVFTPPLAAQQSDTVAQQSEDLAPSAETIYINRGIQVIVYQDRIRLQYDLGLSPVAASALLERKSLGIPDTADRRRLMEAFRDMVVPDIQQRCRLTANGTKLELSVLESQLFPKHYVQLTCIFEAPIPAVGREVRLQVVDGSFRGYDGDHLIALKAAGGAELVSSTVPLILARVPRESLSSDSAAQREAARRAEAVIRRQQEAGDSPRVVSEIPRDSVPSAVAPPPGTSSPPDDRFWTKVLWATGICTGFLVIAVACWLRIRM